MHEVRDSVLDAVGSMGAPRRIALSPAAAPRMHWAPSLLGSKAELKVVSTKSPLREENQRGRKAADLFRLD